MKDNNPFLEVKDHSVSGETFKLIKNEAFGFLETKPQPKKEDLPKYYQTDDYISHTDSKRNLFEKVYHIVRNISLKRKLKLINSFENEEKSLLDIGCGTGDFLAKALNNNWNIQGIEPNESARLIANCKTNNSVYNIDKLLELKKNSLDVITLWHVLEHLPDIEEHTKIIKALLKEKGTLIVAVPNHKSYDAKYYKNFWAAYDVPRHLWHFDQKSMDRLFSEINMKIVKTLPMKFDAFYVSLLSEKYKNKKSNPLMAILVGLKSNWRARRSKEYSSLIYIIKNN